MKKLILVLLLLTCSASYGQTSANVYCGGVNGFDSLLDPSNSTVFRKRGGGLYLHNNGWTELSHDQRMKLLGTFNNHPMIIEVGFPKPGEFGHSPDKSKYHWWCDNFDDLYVKYGIKPQIVAVNLEDAVNNPTLLQPTFEQFDEHHGDLQRMSPQSLILPILGPMNIELPIRTEMVSYNERYRRIISTAGGVVIDSPPKVFITREDEYRDWVVDAIRHANSNGYKSVLIISPHDSSNLFNKHTTMMLRYLELNQALPTIYVVENYIYGKRYSNKVGKETQSNSILGVAKYIQSKLKCDK